MVLKPITMKDFDHQFTPLIQDYQIQQGIGLIEDISHGYLSKHNPTGKGVTLKLTDLQISYDYELLSEVREIIKNTKMCRHDNIVTYYTAFVENERLWIVMEPLKIGSIKQMIVEYFPNGIMNEIIIATILRDVVKGLLYLHANQFIHNNVRADNLMINVHGDIVLGGLYQMVQKISGGTYKRSIFKFVGDPEWSAPEVLSQATTFNEKIDIYSLGITAQELMFGKTPFDGWPPLKLNCNMIYRKLRATQKHLQSYLQSLLSGVLSRIHLEGRLFQPTRDPRPSALGLLEDYFIKNAKNANYIESHLLRKLGKVGGDDDPLSPMSARSEVAAVHNESEEDSG